MPSANWRAEWRTTLTTFFPVILSYSEMLAAGLKPGDPMRADLEEISWAQECAPLL